MPDRSLMLPPDAVIHAPDYLVLYKERKRSEAAVKLSMMQITGECHARPNTVPAANVDDVMREQLEITIEHVSGGYCGCALCGRYAGVRAILMIPFEERTPEKPFVMTAGGLRR